jgi:hypothetical protein
MAAPAAVTGTVVEPALLDVTVTVAGGAGVSIVAVLPVMADPSTVRAPGELSLSLDSAVTVSFPVW